MKKSTKIIVGTAAAAVLAAGAYMALTLTFNNNADPVPAPGVPQTQTEPQPHTPPAPQPQPQAPQKSGIFPITGYATANAAGTLTVLSGMEEFKVRLYATDPPEARQHCATPTNPVFRCGIPAREATRALLAEGNVTCEKVETHKDVESVDPEGRHLAVCYSANGTDIGQSLIRQGWAVENSLESDGRYTADQTKAKEEKKNLWSMTFEPPAAWRRCHPTSGIRPADCPKPQ